MILEIHDEEREVDDRIAVAEGVVELDAVDDLEVARRRAVGEEVDVVEAEVAVAVAGDVARRSPDAIEVRELGDGRSRASFDYLVLAQRR